MKIHFEAIQGAAAAAFGFRFARMFATVSITSKTPREREDIKARRGERGRHQVDIARLLRGGREVNINGNLYALMTSRLWLGFSFSLLPLPRRILHHMRREKKKRCTATSKHVEAGDSQK
jgi:hypothetical protein